MASAVPDPASRGWQVGKTLTNCMQHMLDHEVSCDVTFEIQVPGEPSGTVSAHKLILTARSPVFEAMFSGSFRERNENVTICDIEIGAFKEVLRYMYTDEVTLTGDNVLHVLSAAKKYILEGLVSKCTEFLDKMITQDNVCSILTHSIFYQEDRLIQKSLDLIAPNIKNVSKTDSFYNMSYDALLKVLQYDQLALGAEADLFEGCLEWGKRKVKGDASDAEIRTVLGECLHHIRFPYISSQDFASKFGKTSVLTGDEKSMIFCVILNNQDRSHYESLTEHGFNTGSRMLRAQRYSSLQGGNFTLNVAAKPEEEFTFSTNTSVKLMGFSVYGSVANTEHEVKITVYNNTTGAVESSVENKITSRGDGLPIPVMMKKLTLEPNVQYRAVVSIMGNSAVGFGENFLPSCVADTVTFSQNNTRWPFQQNNQQYDHYGNYTRMITVFRGFVPEILFQRF